MTNGGWSGLFLTGVAALMAARAHAVTEPKVDFNRDVRPLLSEYCFTCHGPDDANRKSNPRRDPQETAFKPAKSGKPAIVPGDLAKSELVTRLTADDEDDRMPPAK